MHSSHEALFRTMVDEVSNEIFVIDPDSASFTFANKTLLRDLEYEQNTFLDLDWEDIFSEQQGMMFLKK